MKIKKWFKEKKEKWDKGKNERRYRYERIRDGLCIWAHENPADAATAILGGLTIVGGGAMKIASDVSKKRKKKQEWIDEECRQWDPRTGTYLYTKKPMTNNQKLSLSQRMKNGEMKAEILRDMKLI